MEESADRLDALVANLLDMSRLQTGSITTLTTEVDLASVAEWTLRAVPGAEPIAVTAPDDLPPVTADPGLLERVIANVVENALKHTDAAAIAVSASAWTSADVGPAGQSAGGRPRDRACRPSRWRRSSSRSSGSATCRPGTASDWVWRSPVV